MAYENTSDHNYFGFLASMESKEVGGRKVVNAVLGVKPFGDNSKISYQTLNFWDQMAERFEKCNLKAGDMLHVDARSLKPTVYEARDGSLKTGLSAYVQDFHVMYGANKAPGWSAHDVSGQIGRISKTEVKGEPVVNVAVATQLTKSKDPVWTNVALYGEKAEAFEKCNFQAGDSIHFKMKSLKADSYKNANGELKVALSGKAHEFRDKRPSLEQSQHQAGTKEAETSKPVASQANSASTLIKKVNLDSEEGAINGLYLAYSERSAPLLNHIVGALETNPPDYASYSPIIDLIDEVGKVELGQLKDDKLEGAWRTIGKMVNSYEFVYRQREDIFTGDYDWDYRPNDLHDFTAAEIMGAKDDAQAELWKQNRKSADSKQATPDDKGATIDKTGNKPTQSEHQIKTSDKDQSGQAQESRDKQEQGQNQPQPEAQQVSEAAKAQPKPKRRARMG